MDELFEIGVNWIHNHQNPYTFEKDKYLELSHPLGDGDGLMTRINRLVVRILPLILSGKIVTLKGGFRGYTTAPVCQNKGIESLFLPFSSYDLDGTRKCEIEIENDNWMEFPPDQLKDKSKEWWYGVLLYYFMRPNQYVEHEIKLRMEKMKLPEKYFGLHVRRGDHPVGRKYAFDEYHKIVITLIKNIDIKSIFLATDDKDTVLYLHMYNNSTHKYYTQEDIPSRGFSCPGTSAAGRMIRAEKDNWTYFMAVEIIVDVILLSRSSVIVGLLPSQVTRIASFIAMSRGILKHKPIAIDYDLNKDRYVDELSNEIFSNKIDFEAKVSLL